MLRKIKKNQEENIIMSMKFKCPKCGFEKLIPQKEFQRMTDETFKNNKIFLCNKCNTRMNPITIEVDY